MLPEIACILFNIPRVTLIHFFWIVKRLPLLYPSWKSSLGEITIANFACSTFVFKKVMLTSFFTIIAAILYIFFQHIYCKHIFLIVCRANTLEYDLLGITLLNVCHLVCPMYNDWFVSPKPSGKCSVAVAAPAPAAATPRPPCWTCWPCQAFPSRP